MAGLIGIIISGSFTVILLAFQVFRNNKVPTWMFFFIIVLFIFSGILQFWDYRNQEKIDAFVSGYAELNPKHTGIITSSPVELKFGTNTVFSQQQVSILGAGAVVVNGMDPLNVWVENGQLKVNAIIRNSSGTIVGRIDSNQFRRTDNSGQYDMNFDRQAIEIINAENNVALQIQLDGNIADVKGIFYSATGQLCIIDNDSMRINPTTDKQPNIQPIFKHPGIKYIGTRIAK